ncbi:MAG: hypothetical protein IT384_19185 [Deltaproteobacteria bacterium]|nr:hypothetical protein [Deltaproteobacteria bacterium]
MTEALQLEAVLQAVEQRAVFGPRFFLTYLPGLLRERCPEPADGLPRVSLHVTSGEILDVCHILGLAPRWVALAVFDGGEGAGTAMRTELVPFETILRISIRLPKGGDRAMGFRQDQTPALHEGCRLPDLSSP